MILQWIELVSKCVSCKSSSQKTLEVQQLVTDKIYEKTTKSVVINMDNVRDKQEDKLVSIRKPSIPNIPIPRRPDGSDNPTSIDAEAIYSHIADQISSAGSKITIEEADKTLCCDTADITDTRKIRKGSTETTNISFSTYDEIMN